ncbi:hypothetical protein KUV57_23975 [Epibacterium sp. DP7N7-1]|nr:hypothetical protein [Epibacterium sp. DP7N7-1]
MKTKRKRSIFATAGFLALCAGAYLSYNQVIEARSSKVSRIDRITAGAIAYPEWPISFDILINDSPVIPGEWDALSGYAEPERASLFTTAPTGVRYEGADTTMDIDIRWIELHSLRGYEANFVVAADELPARVSRDQRSTQLIAAIAPHGDVRLYFTSKEYADAYNNRDKDKLFETGLETPLRFEVARACGKRNPEMDNPKASLNPDSPNSVDWLFVGRNSQEALALNPRAIPPASNCSDPGY